MKTIWKDICTPMFRAALFTIAKTWKQQKCPWREERIKKMSHLYNGTLLSHKKEWHNAICSNMDEPIDYNTKWSKSYRESQMSYDLNYLWNIKNDTNELIYKREIDLQNRKKKQETKGERGEGKVNYEYEINKYILQYINRLKTRTYCIA